MLRCLDPKIAVLSICIIIAPLVSSLHGEPHGMPSMKEFIEVNQVVKKACARYPNVEEELVWSLIWKESRYNRYARGKRGEVGLGQLMPTTAKKLGVKDPTNIEESVEAITRHLSELLKKYRGNRRLALAAYNCGEPCVDRGTIPKMTLSYVAEINDKFYPFAKRIVQYMNSLSEKQVLQKPSQEHQKQITRWEKEIWRDEIEKRERRLNELKALINKEVTVQIGKPNVALVIKARRTESGLSPENILYNLLKTDKANIILNLFKEESFKSKGFFREIYDGDTELLREADDALSKIDYLILGKLNYSLQKSGIDRDLVSCNINFSYKIINKNAEIIKSDNISVVGPGFSEDAALERGLEILSEMYSKRILSLVS